MSTPPLSDPYRSTLAYYAEHLTEFVNNTVSVDMSELYGPFLSAVPVAGRILDAGCGSGRDSLAFLKMGYDVTGIDASPQMVETTIDLTGGTALQMSFHELTFQNEFDGIWACASLLHVSRADLRPVLSRLAGALKEKGILYMSFKYGDTERMEGSRFFNDMNETLVHKFINEESSLAPVRIWTTVDARPERKNEIWLNALVRKGTSHIG